jgi:hypothetical protein
MTIGYLTGSGFYHLPGFKSEIARTRFGEAHESVQYILIRFAKIDFRYYNPDHKERLSGEDLLEAAQQNKAD